MLPCSLRYALVALISSTIVTRAQSMNNTSNPTDSLTKAYCYNVVDLYRTSNASNTYTIPAVVQPLGSSANTSTAPLTGNTTQVWQVKNLIGQSPNFYNMGDEPQLQTSIYLDPQTDGPMALPIPPALSTCNFLFNMPTSDDGKATENGDCSSLLSKACVNDIESTVRELSQSIASSAAMSLKQACDSLRQSLVKLPKSCPKGTASDKFSLFRSQGHNLTLESTNTNCSNGPPQLPIPLFGDYESYQQGNYSTYDSWAKRTTPVLLAFFTNGTTFSGPPFATSHLLCTSPKHVAAGSHNPTNAAERSTKTETKFLVGVALVMNALLFFTL